MTTSPVRTIPERACRSDGDGARRVRIIDFIRTAHLERLAGMAESDVIYLKRRYDFDPSLVPEARPPVQLGRVRTVLHLLRTPYDYAELGEPLLRPRWWDTASQIAALRLRNRGPRRTVIGAYCIGLRDPVAANRQRRRRLPERLDRLYCSTMLGFIVRSTDRLAFGTVASREALERYVDPALIADRGRDIPALPTRCGCLADHDDKPEPGRVLFVGAFDDRKGILQLMQLWDALDGAGGLLLHLVGKGRYLDEVTAWAADRADVELSVDPPRATVHAAYRRAAVLVLLSQRIGDWREQVGLPIVEGLAHGCTVATTSETGVADWLAEHGHTVLDPGLTAVQGARALQAVAGAPLPRADVLASLPSRDGRLAADDWLMDGNAERENRGAAA